MATRMQTIPDEIDAATRGAAVSDDGHDEHWLFLAATAAASRPTENIFSRMDRFKAP